METNALPLDQRVRKECAVHIAKMSLANNMVTIEGIMEDAKLDFFGIRNLGILKHQMRQAGKVEEYADIAAMREKTAKACASEFMKCLAAHIPEKFHNSAMYARLMERLEAS
jgi:hypothetical protein